MQVLIVDDDSFSLKILNHALIKMGRDVTTARNGQEALEKLRKGGIHIVITDWEMPGMDGLQLCQAIRDEDLPGYTYIIMLTGREGTACRIEGLNAGADDFLPKPLNVDELFVRLKTADRILSLETRDVALFALARLAESRDPETGAHIDRVQGYTKLIAQHLSEAVRSSNNVDEHYIRLLHQTSPLHDVGKVAIPDSVLLKPGKLTAAEYEVMKTHTTLGSQTLDAALRRFPHARFLQIAQEIAATHHEKFDGTGYPRGLAGTQIPLSGRIVALADVYDALTSRRVYKAAMSHAEAKAAILAERGKHFDPEIMDAFLRAEDQIIAMCEQLRDEPAAPNRAISVTATPIETPIESFRTARVLVVEDDAVVREKLIELMRHTGGQVFGAGDITQAMKLVAEHSPQVVVSDLEMPGGNGIELCRQIRQRANTTFIHFIMLTVHNNQHSLLQSYQTGVNDFIGKPFDSQELLSRVYAGLRAVQLHAQLAQKTNDLRSINNQLASMNTQLEQLSLTDELTGLRNRRYAMTKLEEQWALAERYNRPLTIAMIDIDHFKRVNDTYGHDAGDSVLKLIANTLREQTRSTDTVCRLGGEEFVVIFPAQNIDEATIWAERCRAAIEQTQFAFGLVNIGVTVSIGIASKKPGVKQLAEVLKAADESLYTAKRAGRNRVAAADQSLTPALAEHAVITKAVAPRRQSSINFEQVKSRCGGDASFAAAVVERFRTQAESEVTRLSDALKAEQIDALRRAAHNLKSMAAYASAERASELSKQIEELARQNQSDDVAELISELRDEIAGVVSWINDNRPLLAIAS